MTRFTNAFPWIVSIFAFLGLLHPPLTTWFSGSLITLGLAGIMLGMGLTLKSSDFVEVLKSPNWVITGLILQFLIMPFLGWGIAKIFDLPPLFAVGMILVSCCPGGTASNVISYLSQAEVALSVCMTACSTMIAIFMTPFLTLKLSGSYLDISAMGLFYSTLKVVLISSSPASDKFISLERIFETSQSICSPIDLTVNGFAVNFITGSIGLPTILP